MARLVVVRLDGGTDSVVGLPDANLPNIAYVREQGASGTLISTVPPITAAAVDDDRLEPRPARHVRLPHARDRALQPAVGAATRRCSRTAATSSPRGAGRVPVLEPGRRAGAILSVPMTFPAWEVDGRMVAGFPLPDYDRNHTQQAELAVLAARRPARGDVVVFQSTDFAQHRLLEMYRRIDAMVGEAREVMRAEGAVAVVSDHGFGPHPRTFVRTDRLLVDAASCPRAARPGAEST